VIFDGEGGFSRIFGDPKKSAHPVVTRLRRPARLHDAHPERWRAFIGAAREMGMPILDDVNRPMVPGAGYINMNIAADGTRVSAVGEAIPNCAL
jgi:hypothetical protein